MYQRVRGLEVPAGRSRTVCHRPRSTLSLSTDTAEHLPNSVAAAACPHVSLTMPMLCLSSAPAALAGPCHHQLQPCAAALQGLPRHRGAPHCARPVEPRRALHRVSAAGALQQAAGYVRTSSRTRKPWMLHALISPVLRLPWRTGCPMHILVALLCCVQSRMSEVFAADIHPGARFGKGILLDHGQCVVLHCMPGPALACTACSCQSSCLTTVQTTSSIEPSSLHCLRRHGRRDWRDGGCRRLRLNTAERHPRW